LKDFNNVSSTAVAVLRICLILSDIGYRVEVSELGFRGQRHKSSHIISSTKNSRSHISMNASSNDFKYYDTSQYNLDVLASVAPL